MEYADVEAMVEQYRDISTDVSEAEDEEEDAAAAAQPVLPSRLLTLVSSELLLLASVMEHHNVACGWGYIRHAEAALLSVVGSVTTVTLEDIDRVARGSEVKYNGTVHKQLIELIETGSISRIADILAGRSSSARREGRCPCTHCASAAAERLR